MYYSHGTSALKINTSNAYVDVSRVSAAHAFKKRRCWRRLMRFVFRLLILLLAFALAYSCLNYAAEKYFNLSMLKANEGGSFLQLQNPQLPNGCEATSLAMALTNFGVPTDKLNAYDAMPQMDFTISNSGIRIGPSPETAYAGNAKTKEGFYCFAPPVVAAANTLLQNAAELSLNKASAGAARDISGANTDELIEYLKNGTGVIAWVTLNYAQPKYCENFTWYIKDERQYRPYSNLHCVYVYGYKNYKYLVNDPLKGTCSVKKSQFEESYIQMGKKAVIIE